MLESIEWLHSLILQYPSFEYMIIFIGAGFGGEFGLLALGFLAAQKIISVYPLLVFSILGTSCADTLWFFLGRTKFVQSIISHRYANTTILIINEALGRVSKGNHLIALVIARFLVGTRVLLIMYVSATNIGYKNFIRQDIIAILIWIIAIVPVGYLSGLGFTYLSQVLQNIYAAIGFVLLIIFAVLILQIWLKRRFTKIH